MRFGEPCIVAANSSPCDFKKVILRHLSVRNFRGIVTLDWTCTSSFVCLLGPGDATKSTILDAVELALSPRWNPPLDDSDFHNGDSSIPFTIDATVGNVPSALLRIEKFGMEARGWSADRGVIDEPADEDEHVLTIRLRVDAKLEPAWTVTTTRHPEGKPISATDREALGTARLGALLDRHMTWSRGAVLARLTESAEPLPRLLADAGRAARNSVDAGRFPAMNVAATLAETLAKGLGVAPRDRFQPALDSIATAVTVGGIVLHDGLVPLRRAGLGTRRLVTAALQRETTREGGIMLIDEFEHGLEPHRVRALVRAFRPVDAVASKNEDDTCSGDLPRTGQVIMTTHSPIVAQEAGPASLHVVRCLGGVTTVRRVPNDLQPLIQKHADALLARKVLVCEGKTELGFVRALDEAWSRAGTHLSLHGVALLFGEGASGPTMCKQLRELGYAVALFGDSDAPLNPTAEQLTALGVEVVLWADGCSVEERLAADLPWAGVAELVQVATEQHGPQAILAALASDLGVAPAALKLPPETWIATHDEAKLREVVGRTAKKQKINALKGWFKRVDLGVTAARVALKYLPTIPASDLTQKIEHLRRWIDE